MVDGRVEGGQVLQDGQDVAVILDHPVQVLGLHAPQSNVKQVDANTTGGRERCGDGSIVCHQERVMAFPLLGRIPGRMFDHSFPICTLLLLIFKWRLAGAHQFHFLCQDQSTVAHLKHIGSHTVPGEQHRQTTPTSLGHGCMRLWCNQPTALLAD